MKYPYGKLMLSFSLAILASCASTQPHQTSKSFTSIALSPDETLLAIANSNEIHILEAGTRRYVTTLRALPDDTEGADRQLFRHGVGDNLVFLDNRVCFLRRCPKVNGEVEILFLERPIQVGIGCVVH